MTQHTTRAEMALLFGRSGVNLRVADYDSADDILDFIIDDATSTIDQYASQLYAVADLTTSTWVRIRCTWIACYLLSQRLGNPSLFYSRYEQIINELQEVRDGLLPIPLLSTTEDMVPSMSNIEHDPRFREKTLRVEREVSTGDSSSKQDTAPTSFLPDWIWI